MHLHRSVIVNDGLEQSVVDIEQVPITFLIPLKTPIFFHASYLRENPQALLLILRMVLVTSQLVPKWKRSHPMGTSQMQP